MLKENVISEKIDYGGGYVMTRVSYNIDLYYNLDRNSDFYSYPSNELIKDSDTFDIKAYGIYLNEEDVTDKLKYRVVNFDTI